MSTSDLKDHISALVDKLRADGGDPVSLTEVAAVTEVLIATSQRYFLALDRSLYREFRELARYIEHAKSEISKLRPDEIKGHRLPRAGKQLDAVVKATEEATQIIMDAAEEIMGADPATGETHAALVNDACMRIIEACSFQDITGQRITRVVETLGYIEERFGEIERTWGGVADESAAQPSGDEEPGSLLNGPQLDGEGIDQSAVDALIDGNAPSRGGNGAQSRVDALFD